MPKEFDLLLAKLLLDSQEQLKIHQDRLFVGFFFEFEMRMLSTFCSQYTFIVSYENYFGEVGTV
jgi:hypothetical protein